MKIPYDLWVIASSSAPKGYSPNILCLTVPGTYSNSLAPVHPLLVHWSLRAPPRSVVRSAFLFPPHRHRGNCELKGMGVASFSITSLKIIITISPLVTDERKFCATKTNVNTRIQYPKEKGNGTARNEKPVTWITFTFYTTQSDRLWNQLALAHLLDIATKKINGTRNWHKFSHKLNYTLVLLKRTPRTW